MNLAPKVREIREDGRLSTHYTIINKFNIISMYYHHYTIIMSIMIIKSDNDNNKHTWLKSRPKTMWVMVEGRALSSESNVGENVRCVNFGMLYSLNQ